MPTEQATYVPDLPKERTGPPRSPRESARPESPAPPDPTPAPTPTPTVRRSAFFWVLILSAAAAAWYLRPHWLPWIPIGRSDTTASAAKAGPPPVPIRTAPVQIRDMPLYLDGLGTVTALRTVTIKSRVDGELIRIAFEEGQIVKEGDLLAEIDPRTFETQLQQAEGQLARDEATLKLARLTLARSEDLLKTKSIAPQQIDEQTAQVRQFEATLETDRALVANARLQLSYCRIVAPLTGRIGLRLVDQGNIVHASDATGMAVITQMRPISVVFTIPQDDIPRVLKHSHDEEPLGVDAWNRDFRTKLATGKLAALDNQVDATTGTLRLKATFDNEDGMLFPNQFVNARLLVDTRKDAIVVPSATIQQGPAGTYVYVVLADETVELRPVVTGPSQGNDTLIESGLSAGETVVLDGIDKLKNGSKVSFRGKDEAAGGEGKPKKAETSSMTEGNGRKTSS